MVAVEPELPRVSAPPSADAIPPALRRVGAGGSPRQVCAIVLVGTLLLAVFASDALSSWLDRMGDGEPVLIQVQAAAAGWNGAMRRLGLTRPAAALHEATRHLLDAEW